MQTRSLSPAFEFPAPEVTSVRSQEHSLLVLLPSRFFPKAQAPPALWPPGLGLRIRRQRCRSRWGGGCHRAPRTRAGQQLFPGKPRLSGSALRGLVEDGVQSGAALLPREVFGEAPRGGCPAGGHTGSRPSIAGLGCAALFRPHLQADPMTLGVSRAE